MGRGERSADRASERDRRRAEVMAQRRTILSRLEQERGTKAITLIHRVEPWDEEERYITIEDSEFVLAQIRHTSRDTPIDLIVHTPGGLALAAEMIAMALRDHPAKVTAIIPFYAMSGGTLIALAADEIPHGAVHHPGARRPADHGVSRGSAVAGAGTEANRGGER